MECWRDHQVHGGGASPRPPIWTDLGVNLVSVPLTPSGVGGNPHRGTSPLSLWTRAPDYPEAPGRPHPPGAENQELGGGMWPPHRVLGELGQPALAIGNLPVPRTGSRPWPSPPRAISANPHSPSPTGWGGCPEDSQDEPLLWGSLQVNITLEAEVLKSRLDRKSQRSSPSRRWV